MFPSADVRVECQLLRVAARRLTSHHAPPRHRALGDRAVGERGEHAAHEGEHPGPDAGSRAARPRA
ncbi:hypothetical protein [Streptomyces sp. NBC_00035]|uniref:hypothetical protein n=1 Tax=Streptomyces sp. NBC_00035 TaxID=2903614 RepID=UPI00324FF362